MLFDTHVHLNAEQFEEDLEEVIERASKLGWKEWLLLDLIVQQLQKAMELVETYDFILCSVGWHPVDAIDMTDEDLEWIEELSAHPKGGGLGEMGLGLSLG